MTSRMMTITVSQLGMRPMKARTLTELSSRSLSASGSRIAPSSVLLLVRRAIAPSSASVIPPSTKTTSAAVTWPAVEQDQKPRDGQDADDGQEVGEVEHAISSSRLRICAAIFGVASAVMRATPSWYCSSTTLASRCSQATRSPRVFGTTT